MKAKLRVFIATAWATCALAQAGAGGAYEAELRRRQYEYQQQQLLRQQQAAKQGYGGGYSNDQAAVAAQARLQQAQAQQALHAQQQQQMMLEAMRRQQQQQAASQGYGGSSSAGGSPTMRSNNRKTLPPMSNKEKARLKKQQDAQAKQQKKLAADRARAFKQAQRTAVKGGRGRSGGGPLSFVFSVKGVVVLGAMGALWLTQRELLVNIVSMVIKYPLLVVQFVVSRVWKLLMKPLLRKLLVARSQSAGPAAVGGELPGGSY